MSEWSRELISASLTVTHPQWDLISRVHVAWLCSPLVQANPQHAKRVLSSARAIGEGCEPDTPTRKLLPLILEKLQHNLPAEDAYDSDDMSVYEHGRVNSAHEHAAPAKDEDMDECGQALMNSLAMLAAQLLPTALIPHAQPPVKVVTVRLTVLGAYHYGYMRAVMCSHLCQVDSNVMVHSHGLCRCTYVRRQPSLLE